MRYHEGKIADWPPNDLEIARIQEDIRALEPADRTAAYARLADYYGVAPSTVRRVIPVGDRKTRVDAGVSRAAIPADAEQKIRQERDLAPSVLIAQMESAGEIEEGTISRDQARRIRDGKAVVGMHTPAPQSGDDGGGGLSFLDWCEKRIMLHGKPWSLDGHEYLREIYQSLESYPYIAIRKAVQMGISTAVLLEQIYRCDQEGRKALYYLDTDDHAADFSDDRVGTLISDSDYLQEIVRERGKRARDNKGLRHIARGSHYLRGLFTEGNVTSVDADMVALDEVDIANQENRKFAADRIRHSPLQHIRELSKPSIPEYGIDEIFSQSDQRYFHLICPECGERTCLDHTLGDERPVPLPSAFRPVPDGAGWAAPGQEYYRACIHCDAVLDMSQGEWIAKNPGARIRGYHVSALYTQICSPLYSDPADEIMAELKGAYTSTERKRAWTSFLGLPYGGGTDQVDDEMIARATGTHGLGAAGVGRGNRYVGVDQGDVLHVVVCEEIEGALFPIGLCATDDWAEPGRMYQRYGASALCVDAMPEKSEAKRLSRSVSQGYICYYPHGAELKKGVETDSQGQVEKITTDRTDSLDETVRGLSDGGIILPCLTHATDEDVHLIETFYGHLKKLKCRMVEGAGGVMRREYLKNVENHFGMALNYARLSHWAHTLDRIGEVNVLTRSYRDIRGTRSQHRDDYAVQLNHDMPAEYYY